MATDLRTDQEFQTFKEKFITKTKGIVEATDITNATDTDMIIAGALAESVRRVAPEDKVDIDSTVASQFAEKTFTRLKITDFDNVSDTDLIVNGALMEAANRIARPRPPVLAISPTPKFNGNKVKMKFYLDNAGDTLKATAKEGTVAVSGDTVTFTAPSAEKCYMVSVVSVRNGMESVPCEVPVYTLDDDLSFTIDESNSNPATCISVNGNVKAMTQAELMEWIGFKPVVLYNGVEVGDVNPNNFKQYTNGSTIPTTLGYDIMIKFPRRGIKVTKDGTKNTYTMTKEANKTGFDYSAFTLGTAAKDQFYVGAYESYCTGSMMYSSSGKTPTVSVSLTNFRTYAKNRGGLYSLMTFDMVEYVQTCYCLVFQNLNSQKALGHGHTDGAWNDGDNRVTGTCDTRGINYGNKTATSDTMKLFGIENFWGNNWQWTDGIYISGNTFTKAVGNTGFSDSGAGYKNLGISAAASGTYVKSVSATNDAKFLPTVGGASTTTYYSDYFWVASGGSARFGGDRGGGESCGVFCWTDGRPASHSAVCVSSRLASF